MEKLISLQDAIDYFSRPYSNEETYSNTEVIEALNKLPFIPNKEGEWIQGSAWSEGCGMGESYGFFYTCSECGHKVKGGYGECGINFCNECGADMRHRKQSPQNVEVRDELDAFMRRLESLGIINGWSKFMNDDNDG